MTMETTFGRSVRDGFEAKTVVDLGFDRRQLHITTSKQYSGGVATNASVVQLSEDIGTGYRGFTFVIFQDYSKRLIYDRKLRATEKAIRDQHAEALKQLDAVMVEVNKQYRPEKAEVALTFRDQAIASFGSIKAAEQAIALIEQYDADTVHAGEEYGIDANEVADAQYQRGAAV